MADKLLYISNDYTQNNPYCRLQLMVETFDTQLHEPTNQNWSPQSCLRNKKIYNKTLGTSEI